MMILFALTWDILGGQMGYNSLGNILFFGAGMYICTIVQIGMFYDVAEYTAHFGAVKIDFTPYQYYSGLALGLVSAAISSLVFAVIFGWIVFGLRGPYFAIGTLGVAIAAGELVGAWDYVGGGGGISVPSYPGHPDDRALFFYMLFASFQQFALSFFSSGFIPQGFGWHSMPSVMMRKRPKQWEFTPTATRPLPGHSLLFSLAYQGVFLAT
jgi:branched-chain amino acid transport system permease protein